MNRKNMPVRIIGLLIIFALVAGTLLDFSMRLQTLLYQDTYHGLTESAEQYNKAFSDWVQGHLTTLQVLAGSLEQRPKAAEEARMAALQAAVDHGGFRRIMLCNPVGKTLSNDGLRQDVSDRAYFQEALAGECVVSQPLSSRLDGTDVLVFSVPIWRNKAVVGVLSGSYALPTAGETVLSLIGSNNSFGVIFAQDGNVVLASSHAEGLSEERNILRFLETTVQPELSTAQLQAAMSRGESGVFAYTHHGAQHFASFAPAQVNDWYTIAFASDTLVAQRETKTNQTVYNLVFKLLAVGMLLVAFMAIDRRRQNRTIWASNQRYQSLLSNINGGVMVTSCAAVPEGIVSVYVSEGFVQMTGYTLEDMQTLFDGQYLRILHPDDRERIFAEYCSQTAKGTDYRFSYRICTKAGTLLWVMDVGRVVPGETDGLINPSVLTDITVMKQQEEELLRVNERFHVAIAAAHAAVVEADLQNNACVYFENTQAILGQSPQELLEATKAFAGLPFQEYQAALQAFFFHPEDAAVIQAAYQKINAGQFTTFEARLRRGDQGYLWCRLDLDVICDEADRPLRAVGYVTDISGIKRETQRLESQVQTDTMTGLYNKVATVTLVDEALAAAPNALHALLVLDVDNFKRANDTLGHTFGDAVLLEVSAKLKALFRESDIVGRIGGDEFVVLMDRVPHVNTVFKKAVEIAGAFRQTYVGDGGTYQISCSIGIALSQQGPGDCYETLFPKADAALYQAKEQGKDQFVLYREEDAAEYSAKGDRIYELEPESQRRPWSIEERIFELLYTSKDFSGSVQMALAMIGRHCQVSRVYVFENDKNNVTTNNIYEWTAPGIAPQINNLHHIPLSEGEDEFLKCFDENGLFYCNDIRTLKPYSRRVLEMQGVLATLQVTMVNDGKIGGFIGFDDCDTFRIWTADEIDTLSFLSKILSIFILKQRAESALRKNRNRAEGMAQNPEKVATEPGK